MCAIYKILVCACGRDYPARDSGWEGSWRQDPDQRDSAGGRDFRRDLILFLHPSEGAWRWMPRCQASRAANKGHAPPPNKTIFPNSSIPKSYNSSASHNNSANAQQ
jgi:hypothetical protein